MIISILIIFLSLFTAGLILGASISEKYELEEFSSYFKWNSNRKVWYNILKFPFAKIIFLGIYLSFKYIPKTEKFILRLINR